MHGGTRDKSTKFWSFNPRDPESNLFSSLALVCDKQHQHQSWRPRFVNGTWIFPTREEAAYPQLLCERMASLFLEEAIKRGLGPDQNLQEQLEHDHASGKRQLFTTQPRQQKLKPVIAEFGHKALLAVPLTSSTTIPLETLFPKGAKVIARHVHRGFTRDVFKLNKNSRIFGDLMDGEDFEVLTIGVPWEPWQFINEAVKIGHPRFLLSRVLPETSVAVDGLLGDPASLKLERAKFLKHWSRRAAELKSQEKALHDSLPEHIRTVVAGKRLLLWKEMLTELDYPDAKVIDEVIAGFPMTGWAELSGVFDSSVRPPEMTVDQLRGQALGLNHSVVDSLRAAETSDLDQKAWEETQLEVDNGWLKPCEVSDLRTVHVAKRFAIQQGAKLRLIDDFSAAGVNQTVGLGEKLRVESVDELAACLLTVLSRGPQPLKDDLVGRTLI